MALAIGGGIALIAGGIVGLSKYLGVFADVTPVEADTPFEEITVASKLNIGGTRTIGPFLREIMALVPKEISCSRVAVYYDNPKTLNEKYGNDSMMRILGGVVLSDLPADKVAEVEEKCAVAGYDKKVVFKGGKCLKSTFQFRFNLGGIFALPSVLIYAQRLINAMIHAFEKRGLVMGHVMEYYSPEDQKNSTVQTMALLDPAINDTWYLPHVRAVAPDVVTAAKDTATST